MHICILEKQKFTDACQRETPELADSIDTLTTTKKEIKKTIREE